MQILEHGQEHERTLLFFPCTAEPVWAFADTIAQLSQRWHVFQVVYDGHQPEYPGDFTSVEQTVDEVISYLKSRSVSRLDGAYGCSMGGACLTRMLALGKIPISRAIIDGGITPYQLPFLVRKLLLARDVLSFKMAANSRKILEAAFPPERFTPAGHDPKKEYDAMEAYGRVRSAEGLSPHRDFIPRSDMAALPQQGAAPLAPLRGYPCTPTKTVHPPLASVPFLRVLLSYPGGDTHSHLPLEHRHCEPRKRQISRCRSRLPKRRKADKRMGRNDP